VICPGSGQIAKGVAADPTPGRRSTKGYTGPIGSRRGADEYRQAGSRKPYVLVLIDLLELTEEPEVVREIIADEKRFARTQKHFKKKRLKARKELRVVRELAEKMNNYGRSLHMKP
jgi:hypothetical protein